MGGRPDDSTWTTTERRRWKESGSIQECRAGDWKGREKASPER